MKSLKQSSLRCVCALDSCLGREGRAAEMESGDHRDSPVNEGCVVFRANRDRVARQDRRESAERMVRWGSVAPLAMKEPKVHRETPERRVQRVNRDFRVRRERRVCKDRRETPDPSGQMSLW